MHERDAGQAKPPLEHNPLSLLGPCYATPRRQLNDPAQERVKQERLPAIDVCIRAVSMSRPCKIQSTLLSSVPIKR
jgi:hypothetical protein